MGSGLSSQGKMIRVRVDRTSVGFDWAAPSQSSSAARTVPTTHMASMKNRSSESERGCAASSACIPDWRTIDGGTDQGLRN